MDAYTSFAAVYDLFMDNVPYDSWCSFICEVLKRNKITDGPLLDLGCGTGVLTRHLSEMGYDMTGSDASYEMLMEAKAADPEGKILYLLQPMQKLDLDGGVRAVLSTCDSLNYLLNEADIRETFRRVYHVLEDGGVFIFDINTDYKYRVLLGENTFAESREEGAFIWDNYYDEDTSINEYYLTLFIPQENGLFERYEEVHQEKYHSLSFIKDELIRVGFKIEGIYDDYSFEALKEDSERATFVVRK